jgi:hypothetical protein
MAYDEARGRMVIAGGGADVWEWRYTDPVPSGSCPLP